MPDKKFGRNYLLLVQDNSPQGTFVSIEPPFTLEFDIERKHFSSSNTANFRLYNLSEITRTRLLKDQFDYDISRNVILQAGYGATQNLPILFSGNITGCKSWREGIDYITEIEATDGGFAFTNAVFNQQFPAGTPQQAIINAMVSDLKNTGVAKGSVGEYKGVQVRASSYAGCTTDLLRELTGGGFFIDNMKANCLNDNECIPPPGTNFINVDSSTGLLGTPIREETFINLNIIFEPTLVIGQFITLKSISTPIYNGNYIIKSLHHKGTISDAICGEVVTTMGAWIGPKKLSIVTP